MKLDYWHKQTIDKPLYPDIEWQKPEQRALAGKLGIIGGNKLGFAAVAQAYTDAKRAGIGEARVVLPDALKKAVDPSIIDCVFGTSNPSGGFSKESLGTMQAAAAWADGLLLIGDMGRNSETAITLETLLIHNHKPVIITRDAVDLLRATIGQLVQRDQTILLVTLAQLQKIFQSVYYPKTILFSMQLTTLVEALHKFTITYPCTLVVFHQNQLVVAQAGEVTTTPWTEPMMIWRGSVAAKASVYALQHPQSTLQAITAALIAR